jgi:hypothetical protein
VEKDIPMKRTSWILGSIMALALVACGERRAADDAGTTGGAGTETGSPGMTADTAMGGAALDTAMTDTSAMGTVMDTAAPVDTAAK